MYHSIGTFISEDALGIYTIKTKQFLSQLHHLSDLGPGVVVPLQRAPSLDDSLHIAITFDDGYSDKLFTAAPLLAKSGFPFTVFICSGAVAERRNGFLRPEEVCELAELPGVQIGSHTVNHVRLTTCDDKELKYELKSSKSYLEDLIGRSVTCVSYPHGDVNHRVRNMASALGYTIGCTSRFDINLSGRDSLLLCRSEILASDELSTFQQKIRGDWDWRRWRQDDPAQSEKRKPPLT